MQIKIQSNLYAQIINQLYLSVFILQSHIISMSWMQKINGSILMHSILKILKEVYVGLKKKSDANKPQNLVFEFADDNIKINNRFVNTKLETIVQNPSIPNIPKMKNGVSTQIENIEDMKSQISSISEEVIQVTLTESELIISGKQFIFPKYPIKGYDTKLTDDLMKYKTLCYKRILEISCELSYEANILSPELRFYPGGATQIYGKKNEVLFRSLLVAVK
ncbi:hypothetical protein ES705_19086 [subsurface metagenome]